MNYPEDIVIKTLYKEEEIIKKAKELANRINKDYEKASLTIVCTLKGALFFFADLMKHIKLNCQIEFIKASSYVGKATSSNESVYISKSNFEIKNRDILIVEDIVDTGYTYKELENYFLNQGCKSIEMCVLLDKKERRKVEVNPKYVGFEIENHFVIGYGLDYNEAYRNLPFIGIINPKYI